MQLIQRGTDGTPLIEEKAKPIEEKAKPPKLHDYEVHTQRRLAILAEHPEIVDLYGYDTRTQYYAYFLIASMLYLAWLCRNSYPLAIFLSFCVGPYLNSGVLAFMHEATHFLVFRKPAYNRILSVFTNMVMCFPVSEIFKQHHGAHHQHLGTEMGDVDVPFDFEVKLVGNSSVRKLLWLLLTMLILPARSLLKLPVAVNKYLILNWVVCLGFTAAAFCYSGPTFLFLIWSSFNSQSLHPANVRQLQEHYYNGEESMRVSGNPESSIGHPGTYSYYGFGNLLTLNVGYHVEHHDFNRIPWTKLPELRRIAGEKWYPNSNAHQGRGIREMWNFVFNPRLTLADFGK